MTAIAFDTETALIRPALLAPPLVCVTWQEPGQPAQVEHVSTVEPRIREWLESDRILVGHNVAFDWAVIEEAFPKLRPLIFEAYAADRITDTMHRQHLLDTASGEYRGRFIGKGIWRPFEYTLESLARRCANIVLVKDGWRMSYAAFLDVSLDRWPERAREIQALAVPRVAELDAAIASATSRKDAASAKALSKERDGLIEMIRSDPSRASAYALEDARATLAIYLAQEKHAFYLQDQFRQARAYWALHLSSAWGLRTDEQGVAAFLAKTLAEYEEVEAELIQLGYIRNDKKRTRDTKAAKARMVRVCEEEGLELRRTEGHTGDEAKCKDASGNAIPPGDDACVEHVCLDGDACEATEDEILRMYTKASTLKKVLSNDVEMLSKGVIYPVHTRYGFAETGRTTSSKPNIQNLRRLAGIREAFVPRIGKVFFSADYPALESYTWAQCCFTWLGHSKLGDFLNAGLDPHLGLAATILGISYEEAKVRYEQGDQEVADVRQLAKVGNFGFPGGMGPPKMLVSAKKQLKPAVVERLGLDLERMVRLRDEWRGTWPEAEGYAARIKSLGPPYPERYSATVETLFTKRFRGGASYCAASNNGFQSLGADCAKEAAWRICREQYDNPTSALFNTRTVAFVHDEFVCEGDESTAHEAAMRLADVMVEGANIYLPNVPISRSKMKPVLMRRWSKDAKPLVGSDGRLAPWAI